MRVTEKSDTTLPITTNTTIDTSMQIPINLSNILR